MIIRECCKTGCNNKWICTGKCNVSSRIKHSKMCYCGKCLTMKRSRPFSVLNFRTRNSLGQKYDGFKDVGTLDDLFEMCYPDLGENEENIMILIRMLE